MNLPYSEELNINYLGRLFDNTSELESILLPVYQSAKNCGFGTWQYDTGKEEILL